MSGAKVVVHKRFRLAAFVLGIGLAAGPSATAARQTAAPAGDLDRFMARVLEHRDEAWKKLQDYVLSETERFDLTGPAGARLDGTRREYTWYVRDGYLIRSPIRIDGVTISEADRRKYEDKWLQDEKRRAARSRRNEAKKEGQGKPSPAEGVSGSGGANASPGSGGEVGFNGADLRIEQLAPRADQRGEPRFISESFFLKFKFEEGNYYLVGRERLDGRDVMRVEYYPKSMIKVRTRPQDAEAGRRLQGDLNKVALVTLWIDPAEYQVLRYKFDNIDFGFLPARWLVRVDTMTATMTMARVLDGVWLPNRMSAEAGFTLATGSYAIQYERDLYDYKKAETSGRIKEIREPK